MAHRQHLPVRRHIMRLLGMLKMRGRKNPHRVKEIFNEGMVLCDGIFSLLRGHISPSVELAGKGLT